MIEQVITLGIGTPSDIPHFLTFGLGIGSPIVASPESLLLQGGYGFRLTTQGANGLIRTVQGADGSAVSVEGGG